jgi:phage terminase large subunit-like protein
MTMLRDAVNIVGELARRRERNPLAYLRLTTPQRIVLADPSPIKLWRDGNQLGKSYSVAVEVITTARGTHPFFRTRRPPVEILVLSISKEQMEPLHRKIWELLPKDEIDERCGFDPGRGITGKPPRVVFTSGPGKGSVIHFATYEQGPKVVAGKTVSLVVLDEPPPEQMYGEVVPRVMRQRGRIYISMTPTPDMPDCTWLRKKVEAGEVAEHNFGLKESNVWLEGAPSPFLTQGEIDAYEKSLIRVQREMRMRGAWEPVVEGNWLDNFVREDHVRPFTVDDIAAATRGRPAFVFVGYDHGTAPNKEAIVVGVASGKLVDAHDQRVLSEPRVWALAAEMIDGHATPELVVERTAEMLREVGLRERSVDVWIGDRAAQATSKARPARMSNRQLEIAWADRLRVASVDDLPFRIDTAFKPAGSVYEGLTLINGLLARRTPEGVPWLQIHPRCVPLIRSFAEHKGEKADPLKDILDGFRYPVQRIVRAGEWMTSPIAKVFVA